MKVQQVRTILAIVILLTIWGCGSDSGGDQSLAAFTAPDATAQNDTSYTGAGLCIGCHQDLTLAGLDRQDLLTSKSTVLITDYLNSRHVIHFPTITAISDPECLVCHDPIGDGYLLESHLNEEDIPLDGLAAVTCEACHGGGSEHYRSGYLPAPKPDSATCIQCHGVPAPSTNDHTGSTTITQDYLASAHFNGGAKHDAICSRCHSDEGAKKYRDVAANSPLLADEPALGEASPIQCRTCHNAHRPEELLFAALTDENQTIIASAEYRTCTFCHEVADAYHSIRDYRIFYDTHFDDPSTDNIEGYTIDPSATNACSRCHNVHAANIPDIITPREET